MADASIAGWQYTGLRVAQLETGETRHLDAVGVERLVVPLAGSFAVTYAPRGEGTMRRELRGRPSVFSGPSDVLYLPAHCPVDLSGSGRVAVAEAPTEEVLEPVYTPREQVAIELRGTGANSRQVHNFGTPANLRASAFMVVEVITPSMNWSSFPAHKHDLDDPVGYIRAYPSPAGQIEFLEPVRTGDVALLPFGYHGPTVAAPGYDMYFLNVMAGPSHRREWLVALDPDQAWVAETFMDRSLDPRLPYDTNH